MAQVDRLDLLAELARREESPGCDAAGAIMSRVRAAGEPRPAPAIAHCRRIAAIAASSAAAAALTVVLAAGWAGRTTGERVDAEGRSGDRAQVPAASVDMAQVAPALDILGTVESEVDQMMGSVAPKSARDVNNT